MRQRGFSLIELLVVVAIVGLLVAILVPSLGKVREHARRAACMSNLRQVHLSVAAYAAAFRDQVPVGYRAGSKQYNSMVYSKTSGSFVLFGVLYQGGYMPDGRAFFCPAERDPRSMFDTPQNPWPPGEDPTAHTYAGYGGRPEVDLPDDWATLTEPLPRLSDFASRAVFADLTANADRVDSRHKTGVNALYGDGSARWVNRAAFNDSLSQCGNPFPPTDAYNGFIDAVWTALDTH